MVLDRIKSLFGGQREPAGPPERVRGYTVSDYPLAKDLTVEEDAWRIEFTEARIVDLFEMEQPEIDKAELTFRAQLRTENAQGRVYLEMRCRFPGGEQSVAREPADQGATGTADWSPHEARLRLKPGQRPDQIMMSLAGQGAGIVWVKDVELLRTPLK
jgi:hypothetical protein